MKELGLLLLGWLLGTFSPVMAALLHRPFARASLRKALSSELHDLRFRLSVIVFQIADRLGTFDRELLEWVRTAMPDERAQGEEVENVRAILDGLLAVTPAELDQTIQARQAQSQQQILQGVGLSLKRILHPIMDANAGKMELLSMDLQYRLSEIRARAAAFNEEVALSRFYFEKTFDAGITPENYGIIRQGFLNNLGNVQRFGRMLADQTGAALVLLEKPGLYEIAASKLSRRRFKR